MLYDIDRFNKRNSFNQGFWDDFTGRDVLEDFHSKGRRHPIPAINVIDKKDEYLIELASPGMCKDNYDISVENDMLTISGDVKKRYEDDSYSRREFNYSSFSRSFVLPEHVDPDKIAASCADGILTLHLPKNEETEVPKKRTIKIN